MLLVLIVTSGFAIIRTAIPPWWIWAYWISPFAYGLRAIVVNEMTSAGWSYSDATTPPGSTVGIQALESFGFQTDQCAPAPLCNVPSVWACACSMQRCMAAPNGA